MTTTTPRIFMDIRTPSEFMLGHGEVSVNVPLQELPFLISEIKKLETPITVCGAGDGRCKQATEFLRMHGVTCNDGGSWIEVPEIKPKSTLEIMLEKPATKNFHHEIGTEPNVDFGALLQRGAIIIDVRTVYEFKKGNIKGSFNIPLHDLKKHDFGEMKKIQVIICCTSGIRSTMAKRFLQRTDFKEVYNGGSWLSLQSRL